MYREFDRKSRIQSSDDVEINEEKLRCEINRHATCACYNKQLTSKFVEPLYPRLGEGHLAVLCRARANVGLPAEFLRC